MKHDIFLLPYEDEYLLYAPLRNLLARVNEGAGRAVAAYFAEGELSEAEEKAVEIPREAGYLQNRVEVCLYET